MRECPSCETCYEDDELTCPLDSTNTKHTLPGGRMLATRYLLEKRLGRGAMGQVYLARDQNLVTRRVAIKTVRPDILADEGLQDGEAIARFEREARAAASIQHPNVVGVTDFGQSSDGVFYLVMEYVEGETLYQLLRREGTLSVPRAAALLRQVVAGVDAAHDAGILHRDLKPANIFIMQPRKKPGSGTQDGFVKVGDFGLAKIIYSDQTEMASATGPLSRGIVGTPDYMAPEQMQTDVQLDARADIYALGTIAYHMLGGRPPFTGNLTQLIAQKLLQAPPPLVGLRSDIPPEVEQTIMRALARDVTERPPSAVEWFDEFETAASRATGTEQRREARVVIMAPAGSEVYVDDERYGSVGRSGRVILSSIAPGQHVLRVARTGEADDERVIEVRPDAAEQIIQAQFENAPSSDQLTPSQGGSLASRTGTAPPTPRVVMCMQCGSRFAEGVNFCGRCANTTFQAITSATEHERSIPPPIVPQIPIESSSDVICPQCQRRYAEGTKFCGGCGISIGTTALDWKEPRPVEVLCKFCNASYPAGALFCGSCGNPMSP